MVLSSLLVAILAVQGPPAVKPAPIAAVPAAEAGPSLEVPAELARLTSADTVAVLFVQSLRGADDSIARIRSAFGEIGDGAMQFELRRLLKDSIRTDLEIPLDQPVLWWIDQPPTDEDEPPMGMSSIISRQAFRIPGATAATEKHRAESAQAKDAKSRPAAPIRARARGSSVSVLPNDIVVVSSDRDPFAAPGAEARPSALLQRLPSSVVCGRIDVGRLLDEQGDQLKMMLGFVQMSLMPTDPAGEDATPEERREAAMQASMGQAVVDQLNHLIDALMQVRRASFAVSLEGEDLRIWADWSRQTAFPTGIDAATVERLASALPRGLQAYWGLSSNAVDTLFTEHLSFDDAIVNLGASDEERKAWADAMTRTRAIMSQIEGGMVGGIALIDLEDGQQAQVVSMRVRDAAAFRKGIQELAPAIERSGTGRMSVKVEGETLTVRVEPNAARFKEAIEVLTRDSMDEEAMESFENAMRPSVATMRFRGNEVLVTQEPSGAAAGTVKLGDDQATDIRKELVSGSWGTLDWFAAMDLRDLIAKAGDAAEDEQVASALKGLRGGKPLMFRVSQGVQGNTARLSTQANLAEVREAVAAIEKAMKAVESKGQAKGGEEEEDDDDDDEDEAVEGPRGERPASAP
jgi:hypothetical protein